MQRKSIIVAALLAAAAAIGGYGLRTAQDAAAQPAGEDGELVKARKEYLNGLKKVDYAGYGDLTTSYLFSVRWLELDIETAKDKVQRVAAYAAHFKRMKDFEKNYGSGAKIGREAALEKSLLRIVIQKEAAYWLAREKSKKN